VRLLTLVWLVLFVGGCGGGGGDGSPGSSAEGAYAGTLTGSLSSNFQSLVLENGEFWSLYGVQTATFFAVAGFVEGSGTSSNGRFTSSNTKDFGFIPALAVTTNATYNAGAHTINGTLSGPGVVGFSGGPVPGSLYNYNSAASLSTIIGAWSTNTLTGEVVAINIAGNGSFTALSNLGCGFSGVITPRASGKNVFNVSLTFGPAPCALPGEAASGIAVSYPLSTGQTQLLVTVVNSQRTIGTAAAGVR